MTSFCVQGGRGVKKSDFHAYVLIERSLTVGDILEGNDPTPTILVSNESLGQAHLKNASASLNFGLRDPPEAGQG